MPKNRSASAGIDKYLKDADKNWSESKEYHEEKFGKKVSSGDHLSTLIQMDIGVNDGRLIVKPKWLVTEGECKGFNLYGDTLWMHTYKAQAFFREFCLKIDEEVPESISEDLKPFCKTLVKKKIVCTVRVTYKDEDIDPYPDKVTIVSREQSEESSTHRTVKDRIVEDKGGDDLDDMNRKQLVRYVEDEGLDKEIENYDDMGKNDLLAAISFAQGGDSGDKKKGVDLNELTRKELVRLVEDEGLDKAIDDYDDLSKKDLMKAIVDSQSGGGKSKASTRSKDKSNDASVDLDDFEAFCKYTKIAPKKKDKASKNAMIKFLKNFEFVKADKLEPQHIELLENLGLEDLVVDDN